MELEEILNLIKEDFPDKSIDISESLALLMDTIDDVMNKINDKIGKAYSNRDFSTVEKYNTLGKAINTYETKIDEIINFTRMEENEILEDSTEESSGKNLPNYEEYIVDNKIEHTLYENFTHIRPFGFKFNSGELIEVRTWQEVLIKTCEKLFSVDEEKFFSFENKKSMNGKKNKYFSTKTDNIRKPEIIGNKLYIETNMSGNGIRNLIIKILKEFDIKIVDYKVYFRADYTNVNKEKC
ncbi:hypothetical protein [Clostridium fallax]|uniref:Uncharacterized protein n=1 Tax=Clostridium fallax TaxID=1533 RepID=A0A1M4WNQ6_9CLOT|nr:hypothetical protein [Clostridium fallax]SHE82879.1 hypothetical protein SAMN05443638_11329 [Clostridium fallax]SQB06248.1 Uncharacterised protein [Clostridium fallax]